MGEDCSHPFSNATVIYREYVVLCRGRLVQQGRQHNRQEEFNQSTMPGTQGRIRLHPRMSFLCLQEFRP